jgi:hypothetical protein
MATRTSLETAFVYATKNFMTTDRIPRSLALNIFCCAAFFVVVGGCSPRVTEMSPHAGPPGAVVSLSMEYLVGWPRVELGGKMMDWPQLKLLSAQPHRKDVPGEELIWIEDKILQFTIPDLPPGNYNVIIHDDKGPPGDPVYSVLETAAYVIFPPVWPFVFRPNKTEVMLRVLPAN